MQFENPLKVSKTDFFFLISYVVTLVADGVRSVRNFNFDKAAASVLTSCVSVSSLKLLRSHAFCNNYC